MTKDNRISIDGNGNISLQDINGSTITISHTDISKIEELISKYNHELSQNLNDVFRYEISSLKSFLVKILNIKNDKISIPKFKEQRAKSIELRLIENYALLSDWEKKKDYSQNPTEIKSIDLELKRISSNICKYENEYNSLIR